MRKISNIANRFRLLSVLFVAVALSGCSPVEVKAQVFETQLGKVQVEKVASGIDSPWAMAMLPNGKLLVTEKDGKIILVDPANQGEKREVEGLPPIAAFGQGGLLDLVLDPEFTRNQTIYFTFSDAGANGGRNAGTAIASATFSETPTPKLSNLKILFSMDKKDRSGQHFGSRIVPDGKGNLYFTIGDRGTQMRAQDPFDAAGTVMRIRTDGSIPDDNPFADGAKALPQIWSIGHRNAQGAALNPSTGELWTLSHGPRGGDEINIPEAGKNYGWPIISYGVNYSGTKVGIGTEAPGFEQPIYYWDPSIAPSGFAFYEGDAIPQWKGNLFAGALKYRTVVRLEIDGDRIVSEERLFEDVFGRIRDVRSFPDGALWFLTDDSDGSVYRVTSAE